MSNKVFRPCSAFFVAPCFVNLTRKPIDQPIKSFDGAQTLTTKAEATAFEEEGEAVVIGLFSSADSQEAKTFMSVAGGIDRLPFATASSKEVLKAYDAAKGGKVVVMKKFDEKKAVLDVTSSTTEVGRGPSLMGAGILIRLLHARTASQPVSQPATHSSVCPRGRRRA